VYERSQPRGEFGIGRLRCLSALSEWSQLCRVADALWPQLAPAQQLEAAPLLAAARWHCQQWTGMEAVTRLIPPTSYEGGFYRAVLATHAERYEEARRCVRAPSGGGERVRKPRT
jgi:FKBP12-rapamycin complex-associated protein